MNICENLNLPDWKFDPNPVCSCPGSVNWVNWKNQRWTLSLFMKKLTCDPSSPESASCFVGQPMLSLTDFVFIGLYRDPRTVRSWTAQ